VTPETERNRDRGPRLRFVGEEPFGSPQAYRSFWSPSAAAFMATGFENKKGSRDISQLHRLHHRHLILCPSRPQRIRARIPSASASLFMEK
jgi:hypothetical protein